MLKSAILFSFHMDFLKVKKLFLTKPLASDSGSIILILQERYGSFKFKFQ